MGKTISIDPITRIEGHLAIRLEIQDNRVLQAYSSGEMFRGFEVILAGRHPLDAQQITQRICGVCPISHGTASILAQDQAYGICPPDNGQLLRNLILGANFINSHLIHFYILSALDFVDIKAVLAYKGQDQQLTELKNWVSTQFKTPGIYPAAPFLPRYEGAYLDNLEFNLVAIKHYLEAIRMRSVAHQMAAIFGGKLPHAATLVPGGVTEQVHVSKIAACQGLLEQLQTFINQAYLPDVVAVAKAFPDYFTVGRGPGNFLAYGGFPEPREGGKPFLPGGVLAAGQAQTFDPAVITEDVKYSRYSSPSHLKPGEGKTTADPKKNGAYSWLKAPRYNNTVMEVGPLARVMVAYQQKSNAALNSLVDGLLKELQRPPADLVSVMGRHAARALECKLIADRCAVWLEQLAPGKPAFRDFKIPARGKGVGLAEAPRGALGHWLEIKDGRIQQYQCVVPTTWNCSPRDDQGRPGAVEQALTGTPVADSNNPLEATRVVRSFDPCIACAVH